MPLMSMTPQYEAALEALSKAADAMTRACNEYQRALGAATGDERTSAAIEALRQACDDASNAHDEALADAWELIEEQSS